MQSGDKWFVRNEDGRVFGPCGLDTLLQWSREGRIAPSACVSGDGAAWIPATQMPELKMDCIVEIGPRQFFGPLHPRNAPSPISITPAGMAMSDKFSQRSKAEYPMQITLSGIDTLLRLFAYLNAEFAMLLHPGDMTRFVRQSTDKPKEAPGSTALRTLPQFKNANNPMSVVPLPISTFAKLLQPMKACIPIFFTLPGRSSSVKAAQSLNASLPICFTLLPITRFVIAVQPSNAQLPISSTLPGIATLVSLSHLANAPLPMYFTPLPITRFVIARQPLNAQRSILSTPSGIVTPARRQHRSKALLPITVTLVPITIFVIPLHPQNANSPIFVTELGSTTSVSPTQP